MQKNLTLQNQSILYNVKVSRRARRIRISVGFKEGVVVTLPWGAKLNSAEKFIYQKQAWVLKCINYFSSKRGLFVGLKSRRHDKREYLEKRQEALVLAKNKVLQWNKVYGFTHGRISIKNQKTRWGSCSKKGNLNFNYKIALLPERLADYIIVHELCHLGEFNHSQKFWKLVSEKFPNYLQLKKEIKREGLRLN
jgi:predicted metal-dependent hydrolase